MIGGGGVSKMSAARQRLRRTALWQKWGVHISTPVHPVATPLACEIAGSVSIFSLLDLNRATKQYRTCCANADVREFQPQPTGA